MTTTQQDNGRDGGPAFPVQDDAKLHPSYGMSLRDYFAAATIPTFIQYHGAEDKYSNYANAAKAAYALADHMLSARTQPLPSPPEVEK